MLILLSNLWIGVKSTKSKISLSARSVCVCVCVCMCVSVCVCGGGGGVESVALDNLLRDVKYVK